MTEPSYRNVEIAPRWWVQLAGKPENILELKRVLGDTGRSEDAHFIIDWDEGVWVITTTQWDSIDEPALVKERAHEALKLFSSIINVFDGFSEITPTAVHHIKEDGSVSSVKSMTVYVHVKRKTERRITADEFTHALDLSRQEGWLYGALRELTPPMDWYSVYRCIEYIEVGCGGSEADMVRSPLIDGRQLKLVKRMANSIRHAGNGKHTPPEPPIYLSFATSYVRTAVLALLVNATDEPS